VLFTALFSFGGVRRAPGPPAVEPSPVAITVTTLESSTLSDSAELGDPPLEADDPPIARPWDAREGDRDDAVTVTVAPSADDGRLTQPPAPDQGAAGGEPPEHAYRRDTTILHARLTDGAAEAQAARQRTARRPASFQAIRREPIVGVGDAVRTHVPSRAPGPTVPRAVRVLALGGEPGGGAPADALAVRAARPDPATRVAADPAPDRTLGPLDAEAGARSFDVAGAGKVADNETSRAASNERHPGLTDFSRPAAPAPDRSPDGRGPGDAPGAVDRAARGDAPAALGAPDAKAYAPDVSARMLARRYDRYTQGIKQRVHDALEFPKALALRLEQGETIVGFVVDVDGRLGEGPRIIKSSGFEEFDNAALRAVRNAAPFPPMADRRSARPLPVSFGVRFDNPVIR